MRIMLVKILGFTKSLKFLCDHSVKETLSQFLLVYICIIYYLKMQCRYESSTYAPNGIQSSYAYDVDGQRVQVARIDPAYKSFY